MKRYHVTLGMILVSAVLIGVGLIQGQNRDVMMKAIRICLECVGIG